MAAAVGFWQALLDANRAIVPTEALYPAGRWALVTGLSDGVWSQLTARTLEITDGAIDFALEVADRCQTTPVPEGNARILLLLLGKGEPWERDHIAHVAIDTLGKDSATGTNESLRSLRTRLIELGYHEAAEITSS